MPMRVLLVEDNPADAELLLEMVFRPTPEFDVIHVQNLARAVDAYRTRPADIVLLDMSLPDSAGLDTIRLASQKMPSAPLVVLTGQDDEQMGLKALKIGAQDYLVKGMITRESVSRSIRYSVERHRGRQELLRLNEQLEARVLERTAELSKVVAALQGEVRQRLEAEQALRIANEELRCRAAQLRALAGELTVVEQRERRRMAKVLHDHLQQLLVGAKFRAAILGREAEPIVQQATVEICGLLDEAIRSSRSLTAELSPPILHEGGLLPGLEWLSRWMAERHGLHVELSATDDPPPLLEDVQTLLFESVRELLFNAVKHARVHSVAVSVRQTEDNQLQVIVSDSGPGFDATQLKPAGETGGGFGLFSIRERLDLVGGRLEIDSERGRGSRFILTVPLSEKATEAVIANGRKAGDRAVRSHAPANGSGAIRVLIADDHTVMREGLTRLLNNEADIEVVGQAADGQAAVDLTRRLRPSIVLMDLSMPKLNGIDATAAISREMPEVHVIGLSMFEEVERAQAMLAAGAKAYLTKSGPSESIVTAIRACAGSLDLTKKNRASVSSGIRRQGRK